ncbi:hypothetical protein AB0E56_12975 [Microbacterium sp. NPDC028030]|uniref:hypothetical protein n=1 Tax=Microbacterium sp. NPDC028030 TaxID=3155124 RepID=UPI0033F7B151
MIPLLIGGMVVLAVGVWAHRAYDRSVPSSRGSTLPENVYRVVMGSAFALVLIGVAATIFGAMWLLAVVA